LKENSGNRKFQECRAGPGQLSATDPSSVTDRHSEFIYKIVLFYSEESAAIHILLFGGFIGYGLKLEPYCPSKALKGDLVSRPSNSRGK
jgi:hypothetical protein